MPVFIQAEYQKNVDREVAAQGSAGAPGPANKYVTEADPDIGAGGPHTHAQTEITGLVTDISGKAPSVHVHAPTDISGTAVVNSDARLSDARTPVAHTQAFSTITATPTTLAGYGITDASQNTHNHDGIYSASGHLHTGIYEPANVNIQGHVVSAHAPASAQANADITKAEIEAKLTGAITSHSHSGGSDPWTYIKLSSDFSTALTQAADITGLSFVPAANTTYEFEAMLLTRTATATVGPRPGVAWATGLSDGVAKITQTSAAATNVFQNGNTSASVLSPVGGVPTTTGSWPAKISGVAVAGAAPSGTVRIQLASETAGASVTAKTGSFLKYRII